MGGHKGMTHVQSAARRQEIAEFAKHNKLPVQAIADIFGVGRTTVLVACEQWGVNVTAARGRPRLYADNPALRALYVSISQGNRIPSDETHRIIADHVAAATIAAQPDAAREASQ